MTSTATGKILAKRITLTRNDLRAADIVTRRFLIALIVTGDVEIRDDPDQGSRPGPEIAITRPARR